VSVVTLRRIALLAALAVTVPVSAFALEGDTPSTGIEVSVSNPSCGVADAQMLCQLDASWTGTPGAEYYTVAANLADGSVLDLGRVEGGEDGASTSVWVPYVGSGTYSVVVSAYGSAPGGYDDGGTALLERDSSHGDGDSGGKGDQNDRERSGSTPDEGDGAAGGGDDPADDAGEGSDEAANADDPEPVPDAGGEPTQTLPECEPEDPAAESAGPGSTAGEAAAESAEATEQAAPADQVECTEPSSDAQGPCCPAGA
jgi:hypothetical protein